MKKTCTISFLILACQAFADAPVYDAEVVKADCAREWSDDFAMQKYCIDERESGYADFSDLYETDDPSSIEALDACLSDWPHQWEMANYCGDERLNARKAIPASFEGVPEDVAAKIEKGCSRDWGVQFEMVKYCIDEQVSAWKSLN